MVFNIAWKFKGLPDILTPGAFAELNEQIYTVAVDTFTFGELRPALIDAVPDRVTSALANSFQAIPAERDPEGIIRGSVVTSDVAALVLDGGAKRHFPTTGRGADEPALATWLRRKPVPFVDRVTGQRIDFRNIRDLKRAAFVIGRQFRRRRRPKKRIFTKAFNQKRQSAEEILNRAAERIEEIVRNARGPRQ